MTPIFLKNTNQETIVKFTGDTEDYTLDFSELTQTNTQQLIDGGTPIVNIVGVSWVGEPDSAIVISRDGTVIFSLPGDQPQMFNFQGQGFVDSVQNTEDIYVDITGIASVYLTLRKEEGWETFVEGATYGSYDDPTQVGPY
mgnify:CR=1 FL=1